MEIASQPNEITTDLDKGACVTIGNFDGVHMGHQKLISRAVSKAKSLGLKSVVVSFSPHPLRVLVGPHTPPFITVKQRKIELIEKLGVDLVLLINFTHELAGLEPEEFVRRYLVEWLNTKDLIVGYDYSFGKNRKGNFQMLRTLGREYGFNVERLDPVIMDGAIVSSTRIRDMIKCGDVWGVRPLLGRFYVVSGRVVRGKDRGGRLLGFPTANLRIENELHPEKGVYAIWTEIQGEKYQGVANIGYNPTFGNKDMSVEAHILDFDRDIYDQNIKLHYVQKIRSEKKFSGLEELIARIKEDVSLARIILASPEAQP